MVIAAWVVAGLVIVFLFCRSHLQINRLKESLEALRDRLDSIAGKSEEQLAALREEIKALTASPAGSTNGEGSSEEDEVLKMKFQQFLDEEINPAVGMHGGFVSLIDVKDRVAFVQMGGGCQGCGMVNVTLKQGIEARMNEVMPEIREIVDTTDHRGGANPYYQPGKGSPMF
ncbi:MAG: NifU family protein [Nitrospinota bacterium]